MEHIPRQQYTKEFREQAVQLVLEQKLTIPEAARRLSMAGKTLKNWVRRARQGQLATVGANRRPVTELEAELSRLKRELAEARMERDILKNGLHGLPCPFCIETLGGVQSSNAWTVAVSFLEVVTPSKNLAQGDLRTHLWRHLRVTPYRKLIESEPPVPRSYS